MDRTRWECDLNTDGQSGIDSVDAASPSPPPGTDHTKDDIVVSVSTTFFPGALVHVVPSDLALLSSDSVYFYVVSQLLLATSTNRFRGLLPESCSYEANNIQVISFPNTSVILNILLHVAYDISLESFSPTFAVLQEAIELLPVYGLSPFIYVTSPRPLYNLLLSHAFTSPMELFALAAHFGLEELAVAASPYLLSCHLGSITDELAARIGPLYLKRLFSLHRERAEALRRLVLQPPQTHVPTSRCSFMDQKVLTRDWAIAAAELVWTAKPDLPSTSLEVAFESIKDELHCDPCQKGLSGHIKRLIAQWSLVKRTI